MKIESFDDEYEFLSNFYLDRFICYGHPMKSVEHGFQAEKATNTDDYLKVLLAPTQGKAKRLGRKIALRSDWEDIKETVMLDLLRAKFSKQRSKELLLNTGDAELIEGNHWHDNEWGNCNCFKCKNIIGKNKLGILLMQVRDEINEL